MANYRTPCRAAGVQHSARPVLAGAAAAAAGTLAWTAVAYLTGYQFEGLAALIGVAVGAATRPTSPRDPRFQAAGAALAVAARDVTTPRQDQPPDLRRYPAGPGWTQPLPQQPDRAPEEPARHDAP
jgi:hypothetical protein